MSSTKCFSILELYYIFEVDFGMRENADLLNDNKNRLNSEQTYMNRLCTILSI